MPGRPGYGSAVARDDSDSVVERLALGTAALAVAYGPPGAVAPPPAERDAARTIVAALELGIETIDTAPSYGQAETIVGRAVRGRSCRIATKVAIPPGGWSTLGVAEVAAHVERSVVASLTALRRDTVDVLQLHNATAAQVVAGPVTEALVAVRERGLARALGATVYDEEDALAVIGSGAFDLVQVPYNAIDRRPERHVLPAAQRAGVAVVARSLLLRGVLSDAARMLEGRFALLLEAADRVRAALGADWEELPAAAAAWVATRPAIALALLGPRNELELEQLVVGAARFAATVRDADVPMPDLPDALLDPRTWPA
jgi:aryl-alcohol dehydrogenase-like predicted oxidoreductase